MNISAFKQRFASSAFKTIDGERRIVGKFCEITILDDGTLDVWIVRPDREPIGTRKLNNMIRTIEALPEYAAVNSLSIEKLDGEAYLQTSNRDLVREVALLTGVKRFRKVSEATRLAKREQLMKIRASSSKDYDQAIKTPAATGVRVPCDRKEQGDLHE